jgi:hypothetical protein
MKHLYLVILSICLSLFVLPSAARQLTVKEQLDDLNSCWKSKEYNDPVLSTLLQLKDDKSLIQMHLALVENKLREKNVSSLTPVQQANRSKCLDILHTYREAGIFPKNTFHSVRTPYFIDIYGTPCAVGHLIIETGHHDLAERISQENNYGYLADLARLYPEVLSWASENGFEAAELAWIQPTYGCTVSCAPGSQHNVSCYGGNDGCANPDPAADGYPAPYFITPYRLVGSSWQVIYALCDLTAGDYKAEVIDGAGMTHNYYYTITQSPVYSAITTVDIACYGNNDGSAAITTSGANPPYTYSWSTGATGSSISGLQPGSSYGAEVWDNTGCRNYFFFTINEPAAPLSASTSAANDNGSCTGSITVTASGGTGPYTYLWNDAAAQTTSTASGLCAGYYSCTVTDVNGCIQPTGAMVNLTTGISSPEASGVYITGNKDNELVITGQRDIKKVSLYDASGRIIKEVKERSTVTLSLQGLAPGIYIITIEADNTILTRKLVR